MKLGEFITRFSHNNLIRLVHKHEGGHRLIVGDWDSSCSMDWEVNKAQGQYRHYLNNEVLGIVGIVTNSRHPDAINIVVEKLENQPRIPEYVDINPAEQLESVD